MRRALVIGIDDYENAPLNGCVADASVIGDLLARHGDGSPNFNVRKLLSSEQKVTAQVMDDQIKELFENPADTVVLFFAGHGIVDEKTNAGFIVSQDATRPHWGADLSHILTLANEAHPKIRSIVIILDSCKSGYAGEVPALRGTFSAIGPGVTILTACSREGFAEEADGHGVFTGIMIEGLGGGCSDVLGRITPASLYAYIDQTLGEWEARPMYKANVQTFITLRQVTPKVPAEVIRLLPIYFPDQTHHFALDPSFEPNRDNVPEAIMAIPPNPENTRIFADLQLCNRHGLVNPVGALHMYYAAINSQSCRLTALGAHYRKLAILGRI